MKDMFIRKFRVGFPATPPAAQSSRTADSPKAGCQLRFVLAVLAGLAGTAHAQNTAFTYQGKLIDDCCPATGYYDLTFKVFDNAGPGSGGKQGPTLTLTRVPVTNGLFSVSLDFGSAPFNGARLWLQIDARTNNAAITPVTLLPRTELTSTPYALFTKTAGSVVNGGVSATALAASPAAGQVLGYNGSTLVWQSAVADSLWRLNGTSAYYNGGNVGIGRSDAPFALSVRGGTAPLAWERYAGGIQAGKTWAWEVDGAGTYVRNVTDGTLPLAILNAGNVGIGTARPETTLDVAGTAIIRPGLQLVGTSSFLEFFSPGQSAFRWLAEGDFFNRKLSLVDTTLGDPQYYRLTVDGGGNVGIGTTSPSHPLTVQTSPGYGIVHTDGTHEVGTYVDANGGWLGTRSNHPLNLFVNDGGAALRIDTDNTVSLKVLTITGGADVAEPFPMSTEAVPKGAVVTIDENHPGRLKMSTRAYDTSVAGIISGANGIKPGLSLHQDGALEGTDNVALSGRVYALADASEAPIKPGDLLTTSATPGHCMRVTDPTKAQGAIIGKAMSSLETGKGMVLVLVSLQ